MATVAAHQANARPGTLVVPAEAAAEQSTSGGAAEQEVPVEADVLEAAAEHALVKAAALKAVA